MFGLDELHGQAIDPSEWVYQVQIANASTTTFEEVVVVYARKSIEGSVILSVLDLPPNYLTLFNLCQCSDLEGFVIGIFWRDGTGALLTGNSPAEGYHTPLPFAETPDFFEIPPDFAENWV